MIVDLVAETGVTDLVETLELVEADGLTVGHEKAMEENRKPGLPGVLNLTGFPEHSRSRGNEQVLAVVGVNVRGHQTLDGS